VLGIALSIISKTKLLDTLPIVWDFGTKISIDEVAFHF
jgi:hypothetical protein